MIGNVGEWCQDWYGAYTCASVIDPQGPPYRFEPGPTRRPLLLSTQYCRSAQRAKGVTSEAIPYCGFRFVLSLL